MLHCITVWLSISNHVAWSFRIWLSIPIHVSPNVAVNIYSCVIVFVYGCQCLFMRYSHLECGSRYLFIHSFMCRSLFECDSQYLFVYRNLLECGSQYLVSSNLAVNIYSCIIVSLNVTLSLYSCGVVSSFMPRKSDFFRRRTSFVFMCLLSFLNLSDSDEYHASW